MDICILQVSESENDLNSRWNKNDNIYSLKMENLIVRTNKSKKNKKKKPETEVQETFIRSVGNTDK